ncbi:COP1-interacting protein 7 [Dionaea muscipula]
MESSARLDYVLFQLTPTRTRCDLVIFAGKSSEKLAYGLLEPFLSHLRTAKDQIAKGGYSVTLRRPSTGGGNGSWFTKATLQRFVRFVSTPEVLERFVSIEREIEHNDSSIRSYEASNGSGPRDTEGNASLANGSSKHPAVSHQPKGESDGICDAVEEDNSKFRLQRVLETRKAVLRKEQAMVFARALAAGFEMDNLGDLLAFSDAFGASRLREACMTFMDLCKKKNEDRLWKDEVAAMQAFPQPQLAYTGSSGIILAGEDNESMQNFMGVAQNGSISSANLSGPTDLSLSDSTSTSHGGSEINAENCFPASAQMPSTDRQAQMPIPWANAPPYLHNFQGHVYQQMPPYQGYAYQGMPYFPGNLQWPQNVKDTTPAVDREADGPTYQTSSLKKKKNRNSKMREPENEDSNDYSEPSDSSSENDSSVERRHRKKHGKKSSKKVVIRNINYITSRDGEKAGASEDDSSSDNGFLVTDSLKQVEEAVGSFEKRHRSTSSHTKKNKNSVSKDSLASSVDHVTETELLKIDAEKKGNGNWDFLQELLMREEPDMTRHEQQSVRAEEESLTTKRSDEPNSSSFYLQAEETIKQKPISADSFLVADKETGTDGNLSRRSYRNFEASEDIRTIPKKGSMPDEFPFSQRHEETQYWPRMTASDCATETSLDKIQSSDDWIVGKGSDKATNGEESLDLGIIDGNYSSLSAAKTENKKEISDDSLMVQVRLMDDDFDSRSRTDISMVSDILAASVTEYGSTEVHQCKSESVGLYEPNDLCVVLDRDVAMEQTVIPWTSEIDYETSKFKNEASKNHSVGDACADPASDFDVKGTVKTGITNAKASTKDVRAKGLGGGPSGKGKPEIISGNRKPTLGSRTTIQNGKPDKEEENRKRKEELLLRRQKRIAERSAGIGHSPGMPKKPQSKAVPASNRAGKPKAQPSLVDESNKATKSVFKNSPVERLAAARTTQKVIVTSHKSGAPKRESSKANGQNTGRGLPKAVRAQDKKLNQIKNEKSDDKNVTEDASEVILSISEAKVEKHSKDNTVGIPPEFQTRGGGVHAPHISHDFEAIRELHITSSITNGERDAQVLPPDDMKSYCDQGELASLVSVLSVPESAKGYLASTLPGSPEISEAEESTPAPINEMSPDLDYSRKKWDAPDNSPKASKGIRKLLMFGRKS